MAEKRSQESEESGVSFEATLAGDEMSSCVLLWK